MKAHTNAVYMFLASNACIGDRDSHAASAFSYLFYKFLQQVYVSSATSDRYRYHIYMSQLEYVYGARNKFIRGKTRNYEEKL